MSRGLPRHVLNDLGLPQGAKADDLLSRAGEDGRPDHSVREQVIALGVEHRVVTAYTALVAVDAVGEERGEGGPRRVVVSQTLPEGLDFGGQRLPAAPHGLLQSDPGGPAYATGPARAREEDHEQFQGTPACLQPLEGE